MNLVRRGDDHVMIFLVPRALFEADGMGDLDAAFDRDVEFEKFRRALTGWSA